MRKIFLMGLVLLLPLVCRAGEPQRIVLDQGERKAVFYRHNGAQYRLITQAEVARSEEGIKVCLIAKYDQAVAGEALCYGVSPDTLKLKLVAALPAEVRRGDNLWLGGVIGKSGAGSPVLSVETASVMPSDPVMFEGRWQELSGRQDVAPEEYFRLAWWMEEGKALATGLSREEFDGYLKSIGKSYRKGLEIVGAEQTEEPLKLAATCKRFREFVDSYADVLPTGNAEWQVGAYRNFLHANAKAATLLAEGKELPETEKQAALAGLCLLLGKMHKRYLNDEEQALKFFLAGAGHNYADPELGKELRDQGYDLFENRWLTAAEIKQVKRQREAEKKQALAKQEQDKLRKQREAARDQMLSPEGAKITQAVVEPLLAKGDEESMVEMEAKVGELPEEAALNLLWRAAALPQSEPRKSLIAAALRHESALVRKDAIDVLLSVCGEDGLARVTGALAREKDAEVAGHAIEAMGKAPGSDGIQNLIRLINAPSVPAPAKTLAAKILSDETGEKYGSDAFGWKQWWQKNRETFKRKRNF
jgi:hypothetical protein